MDMELLSELKNRKQQKLADIIASFDQGQYSDASTQLLDEQIVLFREYGPRILAGWIKISKLMPETPFRLYPTKDPENGLPRKINLIDALSSGENQQDVYFLEVKLNLPEENPKSALIEETAKTMQTMQDAFNKKVSSTRQGLERRLTSAGIDELMDGFSPSLDLNVQEIASTEVNQSLSRLRGSFEHWTDQILSYCNKVIQICCDSETYLEKARSSLSEKTVELIIQEQLKNYMVQVDSLDSGGIPTKLPYLSLRFDSNKLRLTPCVSEEVIKGYFNPAYAKLEADRIRVLSKIKGYLPAISLNLDTGDKSSPEQGKIKIYNQCDTKEAAIEGGLNVEVTRTGTDGRQLSQETLETVTTREGYSYASLPFEICSAGPERVKELKVKITTQTEFIKEYRHSEILRVPAINAPN